MEPHELIGDAVEEVVASWFQTESGRVEFPLHVWLRLGRQGWVRLHTAGAGHLELSQEEPTDSYRMDELRGFVVVEDARAALPLGPLLGRTVSAVDSLVQDPFGEVVGLVAQAVDGAVGFANRADDLLVMPWPAPEWSRWDIRVATA